MQIAHFVLHSIGLFAPLKRDAAYLDHGSTNFIIQLLLASLLGGLFLLKAYWRKIKGFFARVFSKNKSIESPENDQTGNDQTGTEQPGTEQPGNEQQ